MYILIIRLIFICPSGIEQRIDIQYPRAKFDEAVLKYNYLFDQIGTYSQKFKEEDCKLDYIVTGHKKLKGKM